MIKKIKIPPEDAMRMIYGYAKSRIVEQAKSIAFIIIYLVLFQVVVLRVPLDNALGTAGGLTLVIFGLAFFLEGLVLGLMPVGERVGVKLPLKVGIVAISLFGFILGFGATFAEPAISALKMAGSTITAWDSPLLFMLLEHHSELLVISVGAGVGIAVAMGMCRFYFNWSIKPFIFITIPILLGLSLYASFDPNLNKIIGLAWDCGAVTTGAVTVPLVLALGIGVSRASNKGGSDGGFGIILLASAFPVLAVLSLGIYLNTQSPQPTTEKYFFSPEGKAIAGQVFINNDELEWHLFTHGTAEGRIAHFGDQESYEKALLSLENDPVMRQKYLGDMTLATWIIEHASAEERHLLVEANLEDTSVAPLTRVSETLKEESLAGMRAVIPLTLLLLLVLLLFLKEKLRYRDEIALGIGFTLIGMILLTSGIRLGLGALGTEVGKHIPKAFSSEEKFIGRVVIHDFDSTHLYKAVAMNGEQRTFFNMYDHVYDHDEVRAIAYHPNLHDVAERRYTHMLTEPPLFNKRYVFLGFILILIFAFGMGYGATLAEPALNALGMTVESITVGALKRSKIVQVVSVGVGLGICLGLSRILFDLPLIWLIIPSYVLLMVLTIFSEEEFTAIAWDSGGVTTGPVTVPLVLAMGLGIGGELHISDGFGILAMASTFPIITVLAYGLYSRYLQFQTLIDNSDD
mgnify:CR=1 FL=1|tara:strand:- start:57187 stop:59250 length:2064 start_codon:yes stop_codon:yes gene_type:complete